MAAVVPTPIPEIDAPDAAADLSHEEKEGLESVEQSDLDSLFASDEEEEDITPGISADEMTALLDDEDSISQDEIGALFG